MAHGPMKDMAKYCGRNPLTLSPSALACCAVGAPWSLYLRLTHHCRAAWAFGLSSVHCVAPLFTQFVPHSKRYCWIAKSSVDPTYPKRSLEVGSPGSE